eukprot:5714343-Prymnesium_polylepis.1
MGAAHSSWSRMRASHSPPVWSRATREPGEVIDGVGIKLVVPRAREGESDRRIADARAGEAQLPRRQD